MKTKRKLLVSMLVIIFASEGEYAGALVIPDNVNGDPVTQIIVNWDILYSGSGMGEWAKFDFGYDYNEYLAAIA